MISPIGAFSNLSVNIPMELTLPPYWAFDRLGEKTLEKLLRASKQSTDKKPERQLRCKACGASITRERDRISVQGAHDHTCTNPSGLRFHIGCFREVQTCAELGEASEEFTWFRGYAWRILLCQSCKQHLGWGFQAGGGERFYGLILNRLTYPN